MDFEIIKAWIADQHIILHRCRDPASTADNAQTDSERLRRSHRKHSASSQLDAEPETEPEFADHAFDETDQKTPRPQRRGLALRIAPDLSYAHRDPENPEFTLRPTETATYTEKISNSCRPTVTSESRTGSSVTIRTRSTSPTKKPDDLQKLKKHVEWKSAEFRELENIIKTTGSAQALQLFKDITKITKGLGHLPRELEEVRQSELGADDWEFASEDRAMASLAMVMIDSQVQDASVIFPSNDQDSNRLMVLHNELTTWNDHIHGPTLLEAENITTSGIASTCIPPARGELETLRGKMIDYALLLRPDGKLKTGIAEFVDSLPDLKSFNQPTHGPLCEEPTGVLIQTKGKTKLGIWLAAWFGRVAKFPAREGSRKLPFLPVVLVVCDSWKLHFAFDKGYRYEVCGGLEIGSTGRIGKLYQLLAVLRLLGDWVKGEF
ncbi:hypothetical protein BGZ63DRAFT_475793 [Mariannaea sp. PMI_226]|nr:hypothetical protein BGZ63DRAFT_475793 [Mariannaea sp. PMI_226]